MTFRPEAVGAFRYTGYELDHASGELTCHYALDELSFVERISVPGGDWTNPAVAEAARLVYLLAGVSYYKAAAPPLIDLGNTAVRDGDIEFLHNFYLEGLGEYAFRNELDLSGLQIKGGVAAGEKAVFDGEVDRPLIPFGGGIDSIVTVESERTRFSESALFVMDRKGDHFAAIEAAARVTNMPVLRAEREIDPKILRSGELGFRNGHVPVTGVLSSVAILTAAAHRRGAVVMSNEWSASTGNVVIDGRVINHQYSKSIAFEAAFQARLEAAFHPAPQYFSLLRSFSELAIAKRFAQETKYHRTFRSCNRAFRIDPSTRYDKWCGECDKCCFIDLILAPFMSREDLVTVFNGNEPLANAELMPVFRTLIDVSGDVKPWECVGDVGECRTALVMASKRDDRATSTLIADLISELGPAAEKAAGDEQLLMAPMGPNHVPPSHAPQDLLG